MKSIVVSLPKKKGDVRIIPFSDLHIGSSKCNYDLIKSQIEKVKQNENTYAIIVGDLINNTTKTSCGDVYSEPIPPMKQIEIACDLFEPIKDKILAVTSGNHERRSYKMDGVDLMGFFCLKLGIEKRYDYCAPLLFLGVGAPTHGFHKGEQVWYTIYITHGDGANGRTIGGKANALGKRGGVCNADVIITGHTHEAVAFKEAIFVPEVKSKSVQLKETTFVNCGSTLDYEEYAELYGMRPSVQCQPEIILSGIKKDVKVQM